MNTILRREKNFLTDWSHHSTSQWQRKKALLLALWFCLGFGTAMAQTLINSNPADMGDARANLLNPAIVAWQDPLFMAGSEILFPGIVENNFSLRNNFFSLTSVDRKIGRIEGFGFGVQGQYLTTPMMNNLMINAMVSKKFLDRFSVGASLGFLNRAYDRTGFGEYDPEDPLLKKDLSKWTPFNLGFGLLVVPFRHLTFGFSVNQLSRPDIALSNIEARVPRAFNAGAAIGMSYFRAILGFISENHHSSPTMALEAFRPELGFLKMGYSSDAALFEGQLHVGRGVSLNYRYHYPVNDLNLASSGSHELGLVFNFRRQASLYDPSWLKFTPRRPVINPATAFVVESVFDTLLMQDTYIHRKIDPHVRMEDLAELPEDLFFSSDSLEPDLPKMGASRLMSRFEAVNGIPEKYEIPNDSAAIVYAMQKDHKKEYLEFLHNLAQRMKDPTFRATIVVPPEGRRAYLLLKYLSLYGALTDRIQIAVQDTAQKATPSKLGGRKIPEHVYYRTVRVPADTFKFDLQIKDLRWGPVWWTFILEDSEGKPIHSISGERQFPRRHIWDWRLDGGHQPLPGTYYYYIRWKSGDGQVYTSPRKPLVVRLDNRRIAIAISRGKDFEPNPRSMATIIVRN
ncbi:MAG: type IX secretion system membrane protein PorP/SprF [candidate division KSB1 bacterium]|nr:type IX secretion system membrane protein PorP/SprF [candidate division KSB1 bacterium]MDZ7305151.1 type IX secretion system membrane protein PorP/SprF [candidate division KSB1 bacterium]MDZ7314235.1 type IX secretion system membrane protein PorP/SprF [candidate division KSB1 bacterium]